MSRIKVIIISHLPLPYHKIGSWTTMYDNYIRNKISQIDLIICPKPKTTKYNTIQYLYYKKPLLYKLKSKLINNRFYHILNKLHSFIKKNPNDKYIIQVIDNQGLLKELINFKASNRLQNNFYLQYFFHGFLLNNENNNAERILPKIDEFILLTRLSLHEHKKIFKQLPKQTKVLHNGIDTKLFNSKNKKSNLNKTIFLWCSQDRPKKGLHIILEIWDKFHRQFQDTELWIVGTYETYEGRGINCFGRKENHKLPEIYNKADVYLFPTLCHEGFGLTLAEALHCGCFCIASNIGGVPEVLNQGKYGWLINEPHNEDQWLNAMINYIKLKPKHAKIPKETYTLESWSNGMNKIINKAKKRMG